MANPYLAVTTGNEPESRVPFAWESDFLIKLRQSENVGRRLTSERGQTLVLALIVLLVLTISAGAIAQLITSNQNNSNNERQGVQAFTGGEAGLDVAANWVVANDAGGVLPPYPATPPQMGSVTVAGSLVTWTATKVSTGQWKVDTTTHSPNGQATRVLQEQLQSKVVPGSPAKFWNYGLVMGGQKNTLDATHTPYDICEGGTGIYPPTTFNRSGNGLDTVPTWIGGDVCTSGDDSQITNPASGAAIPVHIGGFFYTGQGPRWSVGSGSPVTRIADFEAVGGCYSHYTSGGKLPVACDTAGNATSGGGNSGVYSSSFAPIADAVTPPKITPQDEQAYYDAASPGPMHPCDASLAPGPWPANLFDSAGSTVADTSRTPAATSIDFVTLLGNTSFDCKTALGELKWTKTSSPSGGTLLVKGTVFFDANLTLSGGNDLVTLAQDSDGSIYIDGWLQMRNSSSICGYITSGACDPTVDGWSPATNPHDPNIYFSAFNRSNKVPGIDLGGNSGFEGTLYTNGKFLLSNGASLGGSIFADYATITGDGRLQVTGKAPAGSTGSATTTTGWSVAPRTWRQCPVSGCS